MFFIARRDEIPKEYIENGWYASEDDLINSIYIEDIKEIRNVESELLKYIDDLSIFQPEWHCEIPL